MKRDFAGATGLFGVVLKPIPHKALAAFFDSLKLFGMGFSWGGYESLIVPSKLHRSASTFAAEGPLIRIHAGLEHVDDLKADLERGFAAMKAAT